MRTAYLASGTVAAGAEIVLAPADNSRHAIVLSPPSAAHYVVGLGQTTNGGTTGITLVSGAPPLIIDADLLGSLIKQNLYVYNADSVEHTAAAWIALN